MELSRAVALGRPNLKLLTVGEDAAPVGRNLAQFTYSLGGDLEPDPFGRMLDGETTEEALVREGFSARPDFGIGRAEGMIRGRVFSRVTEDGEDYLVVVMFGERQGPAIYLGGLQDLMNFVLCRAGFFDAPVYAELPPAGRK